MPIGDIGHWRDTAGGQLPTTTWAGFNFAGQQRNDNTTYSKPNDSTIEIEEAGDFLIWGHINGTDGDNGRHGPQGRLVLSTGTGDLFTSYISGYNRNNANNNWSLFFFGVYVGGVANDQIQIQVRRGTDVVANPGSTINESDVQIVRLGDNWNYGIYQSNSAGNAYGGTTPNDVAFATTILESDTAVIEKQVGDTNIRLKSDNTRFLIGYSVAGDTGGDRTQRLGRAVTGSTEIDASRSYFYQRNATNEFTGLGCMFLHETATADEDISIQVYRGDGILANEGGADVDGSWTNNSGEETALIVIELPSTVEVFASVDGTAGQDIAGGVTSTINAMRTVNFNDSASFTAPAIDTMDVAVAMDALVWANFVTARATVGSGVRLELGSRVEIDGVDQTTGQHYCYTRGAQSTQDTFGGSWHPGAIFSFTAGQDVQFETFDSGDNGGDDTTRANEVGAFAINLDSLEAGDVNVNATGVQSASAIGTTTVTGDANPSISGISSASAVGSLTVSVDINASLTGVSSPAGVGSLAAIGDAVVTLTGTQSATSIGDVTCLKTANVNLLGIAATAAVGTLTVTTATNATANVTGVASTSGVGTLTVDAEISVSPTLTGIQSATGIGALTVNVAEANVITGVSTSGQVGVLTVQAQAIVNAIGIGSSASPGVLTVTTAGNVNAVVTGVAANTSVGALATIGDASIDANGVQANAGVGSLAASIGEQGFITGVQASSGIGALTTTTDIQTSVSGAQTNTGLGALTVTGGAAVALSGIQSLASVGNLTVQAGGNVSVGIGGIEATGQIGSITAEFDFSASLSGVQATQGIGTLTAQGAATANLTGIQAVSGIGALTVDTQGDATGAISGVSAAAQVGALSVQADANVGIGGISSSTATGTVIAEAGDVQVALGGVQALGSLGVFSFIGIANVALTGVQAASGVGLLASSQPIASPWNTTRRIIQAIYESGDINNPAYDMHRKLEGDI